MGSVPSGAPLVTATLQPPQKGTMETQASIANWSRQTFGEALTLATIAARANQEMAELIRKTTAPNTDHAAIAEECADVLIVLYRLVEACGFDMHEEVNRKMSINRQRTWHLDGDGCGQHKE